LPWSFTVSAVAQIGAAPVAPTSPVVIQGISGDTACATVFLSTKNGAELDKVTITEQALPANWALTHIHVRLYDDGPYPGPPAPGNTIGGSLASRSVEVYINSDMQRVVTFTNDFTAPPPPDICTYTKGWYRNNGSSTVIAVDGRSIAEAQAIFNATPGKPGSVTFGGDNTLLNLYQQFLAALNNLGGDINEHAGPQAVDDAIDDVRAGTGGTGLDITTTLSQSEMSALIATLSSFNEGQFAGVPHCDD
jgi:hypothetical protein